jgi:hypothetical protein
MLADHAKPRATGNEGHVSTEDRSAQMAKLAGEAPVVAIDDSGNPMTAADFKAPADVETVVEETAEEKSDRLLAEWKLFTADAYNGMSEDDRKKGRTWYNAQRWGVKPALKAA